MPSRPPAEPELFVACLPGLESLLADEIGELELGEAQVEAGGVSLRCGPRGMLRANLELGLASHVLARVASFHARNFGDLVRKTMQIPWQRWLGGALPQVRAVCRKSRLIHSGAVAERVREGIAQRLQASADGPGVVHVRLRDDVCTLSLDTSGEPLHRRGARTDVGKAPLREDLARALVRASGWDRQSPLLDPMVGSGTIVLEAAALARRLAPGRGRAFAFEGTPLCDEALWREVRTQVDERALPACPAPLYGSDRDAGAIERARANAQRLGVASDIEFQHAALRAAPLLCGTPPPPPAGALVTNPPFGRRIASRSLHQLYQALGVLARKLPAGWRVALVAADRRLALRTGIALKTAFLTVHGGLKVRGLVCGRGAKGNDQQV
jgi:putative N6-adenine-specific DNA methylase